MYILNPKTKTSTLINRQTQIRIIIPHLQSVNKELQTHKISGDNGLNDIYINDIN